LSQLSRVNLTCPTFHNPADYIAEIASGEHDNESIAKLAAYRSQLEQSKPLELSTSSRKLAEISQNYKLPAILHTLLLIKRSFKLIPREPYLSWLRLFAHVMTALFLSFIFGSYVGTVAGCPPQVQDLYTNKASDLFKTFEYESKKVTENVGSIFYNVLFLMFAGLMPIILVFPSEVNVFIKQQTNGWYSPFTYFISKIISDIPILVTGMSTV
jgi:ATP-binding cassette subfamily G (WHITE) protein 1